MSCKLVRLCEHDEFKPHPIEKSGFFKLGDCPGGEFLPEAFVVPAAEGQNEEPYELGWCAEHHDVARRWPDGSWNCWWESVVEASGNHSPSDFRPLWDALADQVGEPG